MNGLSAPRRGREHPLPAESGAARTEGKEGGEARESVSARERPGKRRRNWARRAAASPRASCGFGSSEGGGAAAPPAALGTRKAACQRGHGARKGRDESCGPCSDLEAPRPPPPTPAGAQRQRTGLASASGVPRGRAFPAPTPPRSPRFGSPAAEHSAAPLCRGAPTTPRPRRRGSGEGGLSARDRRLPGPPASRSRKRVRKGFGLLTATGEWRSARCGAQLPSGDPRVHHGSVRGQLEAFPARAAGCCFPGKFREAGSREAGGRRSRRPGWERGRRASGVCPGARQAAAAPGKVLSAVRRVAPRAGAAQVQLGRAWVSAKGPGAEPGPSGREGGAPSGAGSRLGMEGGAEMVKWRGAGRSAREPRGA